MTVAWTGASKDEKRAVLMVVERVVLRVAWMVA